MKGDRQIAETRAEEMTHLSISHVSRNSCLLIHLIYLISIFLRERERAWRGEEREKGRKDVSIKLTYSTDEARIVPAVAQGLQEPITGINLKVTAVAFGAEHLLIVCGDKGDAKRAR